MAENHPYHLHLLPRQKFSFLECFAFRAWSLVRGVHGYTRTTSHIVLDSARGWTTVPMTSMAAMIQITYAFHGVYVEFTWECVNKPSGYALGHINIFLNLYTHLEGIQ